MKTNELLNADPDTLTPGDAAAAFNALVQAAVTDEGLDFNQAWARTKRLNPKLFAKMISPQPEEAGSQTTAGPAPEDDVVLENAKRIRRQYLAEFTRRVDSYLADPVNAGCDVIAAFRQCRRLFPVLANQAGFPGDPSSGAIPVPPKNFALLAYLHLPADTTQLEFEIAVRANGGTVGLNPRPMFAALVEMVRREKGIREADAIDFCRKRFSALFAKARAEASAAANMSAQ